MDSDNPEQTPTAVVTSKRETADAVIFTETKRMISNGDETIRIIIRLEGERTQHITNADWFYKLQKYSKTEARQDVTVQATAIDFEEISTCPKLHELKYLLEGI